MYRQTDELIRVELGNLRFPQVNIIESGASTTYRLICSPEASSSHPSLQSVNRKMLLAASAFRRVPSGAVVAASLASRHHRRRPPQSCPRPRPFSSVSPTSSSGDDDNDGVGGNTETPVVAENVDDVVAAVDDSSVDATDDAPPPTAAAPSPDDGAPKSSGGSDAAEQPGWISAINLRPTEVVAELNRHIVGQSAAKRAVAIAMRNRWRRRQLPPDLLKEVTPRNVLMIGPTGCGKTEVARRMAKLSDAPFLKVEATKFTEVGYHGRDVDQIVRDLMDVIRAA